MNRRLGAEATMGIGGRPDSKRYRENLDKAEDLCRKKKPEKALPYLLEAIKEGHNLDALIQLAFLFDRPNAIKCLEAAEKRGRVMLKHDLGDDIFEESSQHAGDFWLVLETRPYMRVLQALVRLYFENEQYNESAATMITMLRHCPQDNLSQRDWLGSVLVRVGRNNDALSFAQAWTSKAATDGKSIHYGGTDFSSATSASLSSSTVFTPTREIELSQWCNAVMAYTGAIASFKLFGDTPQARQFLKIAVRNNPHAMTKVLGKAPRPKNLNHDARAFNGPEAAHDYLWLAQDLWETPDVWAWINGIPEVKATVLKRCSQPACGLLETNVAQFKRCASCHQVVYCGQECQKLHWKTHKPACLQYKKQKDMIKLFARGANSGSSTFLTPIVSP